MASMARAILKRNKVLFMDEATASIDCKRSAIPVGASLMLPDETDELSKSEVMWRE